MTDTIIVAVAVGVIVGGFSTWLTHRFDRWRRQEIREEERQRELRQMLEALMNLSRRNIALTVGVRVAPKMGIARSDAYLRYLESLNKTMDEIPVVWRPYRIPDARLHQLAESLATANSSLTMDVSDENEDQVDKRAAEIRDLLEKVDVRMDELGW